MELASLLESAQAAPPERRIEWRDGIAAYGASAIEAVRPWLVNDSLAAFAVRVIERAGINGEAELASKVLRVRADARARDASPATWTGRSSALKAATRPQPVDAASCRGTCSGPARPARARAFRDRRAAPDPVTRDSAPRDDGPRPAGPPEPAASLPVPRPADGRARRPGIGAASRARRRPGGQPAAMPNAISSAAFRRGRDHGGDRPPVRPGRPWPRSRRARGSIPAGCRSRCRRWRVSGCSRWAALVLVSGELATARVGVGPRVRPRRPPLRRALGAVPRRAGRRRRRELRVRHRVPRARITRTAIAPRPRSRCSWPASPSSSAPATRSRSCSRGR